MYPRLVIDKTKLTDNVKAMVKRCKTNNLTTMGVTKVFCADSELTQCYIDGGIDYLADSRLLNLKKLAAFDIEKVLLRLPALSEVEQIVDYSDISLNSEITTIKALGKAAQEKNKVHKIILMVDLGDLREGVWPTDFDQMVTDIKVVKGIELFGLGVNLTCYGGVIPTVETLSKLTDLATKLKEKHGITAQILSGGNSSSVYLLDKGEMPTEINNLRLGESIVLGRETAYGDTISGTHTDVFKLEAEIIEKKRKPSLPIGKIGMDAFGNKPNFEDKGERVRAILAIGRQDVHIDNLIPEDKAISIFGASSDHLIVDLTDVADKYRVGDIVRFDIEYGAMLALMTSPYVEKTYK